MLIRVLSDLHLEFVPVRIPTNDADVIILAGDIDLKLKGLRWAQEQFVETPVLYVLGNHEFYGAAHPRLIEKPKPLLRGRKSPFLKTTRL